MAIEAPESLISAAGANCPYNLDVKLGFAGTAFGDRGVIRC